MEALKRAKIDFAPVNVVKTDLPGGGFIIESAQELKAYPDNLCKHLERWAKEAPDRVFIAERDKTGGWRKITYAETLNTVRQLAQGLLSRGVNSDRPVMILSDNSVDSGLLILASLYAGIAVVPVSQAYSLVSEDHSKLKYIYEQVLPGLVFAASGKRFEKAFKAIDLKGVTLVVGEDKPEGLDALLFDELKAAPGPELDKAYAAVTPDTVAKILFTSGSTGMPKGVINTHRMLCSNQQAIAQIWPFLDKKPPVVLDWLPWNHTFGGNHNFNMVLRNGGSLYLDDGKPVPGAMIEKTVRNLKEVSPTLFFNVPRGYDMLLPYLEADEELNRKFFKDLDVIFYAAAALPQPLWERLEKLSMKARGELVTMVSSWGSTETAPCITSVHFHIDRAGVIGLPVPGTKVKFLPNGSKLEMRVKGPGIMPGYFKSPDQTRDSFDEEGYYCIGDAGKLADPNDPSQGIVFDGRVSEDFKLTTGTWVHVGGLRLSALEAAAPYIQDGVITGHNKDYLGIMAWPNVEMCKKLIGDDSATAETVAAHPKVRETIADALRKLNAASKGSSTKIEKLVLLVEPPNLDGNEITDKGYINQRATLERRANLVDLMYAEKTSDPVISL